MVGAEKAGSDLGGGQIWREGVFLGRARSGGVSGGDSVSRKMRVLSSCSTGWGCARQRGQRAGPGSPAGAGREGQSGAVPGLARAPPRAPRRPQGGGGRNRATLTFSFFSL